jgi:CBS domain-containing protein
MGLVTFVHPATNCKRHMKKHLVRDWMNTKILSISPDSTLTEADVTMEARRIRRLLVVEDGKLVGVLSQGDLREAKAAQNPGAAGPEPKVRDMMSPDPITMSEHASIALAAQTMLQAKISGLPVVNPDGKLIGLLSESDLFRFVIHIMQEAD